MNYATLVRWIAAAETASELENTQLTNRVRADLRPARKENRWERELLKPFDLNRNMVVLEKGGPWELATNTALQKGEDYVIRHCERYRAAKPMLEAGVNSSDEMFDVMHAVKQTSGPARTLWTSVIDLRRMTYQMRYFKEYERRFEIDFSPRLWSGSTPPSSNSTVP